MLTITLLTRMKILVNGVTKSSTTSTFIVRFKPCPSPNSHRCSPVNPHQPSANASSVPVTSRPSVSAPSPWERAGGEVYIIPKNRRISLRFATIMSSSSIDMPTYSA